MERKELSSGSHVTVIGIATRCWYNASAQAEYMGRAARGEVEIVGPANPTRVFCAELGHSYKSCTTLSLDRDYYFAVSGVVRTEEEGRYELDSCSFRKVALALE